MYTLLIVPNKHPLSLIHSYPIAQISANIHFPSLNHIQRPISSGSNLISLPCVPRFSAGKSRHLLSLTSFHASRRPPPMPSLPLFTPPRPRASSSPSACLSPSLPPRQGVEVVQRGCHVVDGKRGSSG
jgi:hypothetical protein